MDASRVIVIIAQGIHAISTLGPITSLIQWREWVESRIDGHQLTSSRILNFRLPSLHHLTAIGSENISGVLAHASRWWLANRGINEYAVVSADSIVVFCCLLSASPKESKNQPTDKCEQRN